jgi:ElaB/YqjD/DUF883 family membrane-anchored ribosome-binding protein
MNDQKLENKIQQEATQVVKDVDTLAGDTAVRLGRLDDNISQAAGKAKEDLTAWAEHGATELGDKLEKLTDKARNSVNGAAVSVKKDVGHGLIQYNKKAKQITDYLPGKLGEKAVKYPWVTISVALGIGFLLGGLIKPTRRLLWQQ